MVNTDAVKNSWRDEVQELFGIKWGNLLEYVVVGFCSLWFWVGFFPNAQAPQWPLQWLISSLENLSISTPSWLVSFENWLSAPVSTSLVFVPICISVALSTLSVRGIQHTGLRVASLLAMIFAIEMCHSISPVIWTLVIAGAIALGAIIVAITRKKKIDQNRNEYFSPQGIFQDYLLRLLVNVYLLPVVFPFVVAAFLICSYRHENYDNYEERFVLKVAEQLKGDKQSIFEIEDKQSLCVFAAVVTSMRDKRSSQIISSLLLASDSFPRGAKSTSEIEPWLTEPNYYQQPRKGSMKSQLKIRRDKDDWSG